MKPIAFSPDWALSPPVPAPSPIEVLASADEGPSSAAEPGRLKVVIAEDDPISREIASTLVRKWGYEVLVTQDGREAMEALRAQTAPTIALLDWMMPGMDGIEVCRRVREAGKPVYIILITARSGKAQLVEGFEAGADDYLVKPFDHQELRARVQVGARILHLQRVLSERVRELEALASENRLLRLQIPL